MMSSTSAVRDPDPCLKMDAGGGGLPVRPCHLLCARQPFAPPFRPYSMVRAGAGRRPALSSPTPSSPSHPGAYVLARTKANGQGMMRKRDCPLATSDARVAVRGDGAAAAARARAGGARGWFSRLRRPRGASVLARSRRMARSDVLCLCTPCAGFWFGWDHCARALCCTVW